MKLSKTLAVVAVMGGTVTYHDDDTSPMEAHRRPSTYQWPLPAGRAR